MVYMVYNCVYYCDTFFYFDLVSAEVALASVGGPNLGEFVPLGFVVALDVYLDAPCVVLLVAVLGDLYRLCIVYIGVVSGVSLYNCVYYCDTFSVCR
jgi:hypothetical protein